MNRVLQQMQGWMLAAITQSGGIKAGLAGQPKSSEIEEIISSSMTLSPAQRLAIYNRSYHARMLNCFDHMFPALKHAMGEELFHRFALDYLHHHPSTSYTIDHLADAFPQHLAETRPDHDLPRELQEGWCDFICELATIEHDFLTVFDGPGLENQRLPSVTALLELEDERLLSLRPVHAPCLHLVSLRYPVHDYLVSVRQQKDPSLPPERKCLIAMTRLNYRVVFHELDSDQYNLLSAIDGQQRIVDLLREVADLPTLRGWIASWTAKGLLGIPT